MNREQLEHILRAASQIDPAIVSARIDTLELDPRVMNRLKRWIGMCTSTE